VGVSRGVLCASVTSICGTLEDRKGQAVSLSDGLGVSSRSPRTRSVAWGSLWVCYKKTTVSFYFNTTPLLRK
jgi:hypothetical protein